MKISTGLTIGLAFSTLLGFSSVAEARLESPLPQQQAPIEVKGADLVLVFSAGVDLPASTVEIRDVHRQKVEIGKLRLASNGTDIKIPLKAALRPGVYVLSWHAVSTDGRESVGSYAVTIDPGVNTVPAIAKM